MKFYARDWDRLHLELEQAFERLKTPQQPTRLWSVAEADLPPAAAWPDHIIWISDLAVAAVSDGTDWIGLDDGSAV